VTELLSKSADSPKKSESALNPFPDTLPAGAEILVVLLGRIGDVIFTMPSILALKNARPDLRIDWVVEDRCSDLLVDHPALRNVIVFPRKRFQDLRTSGKHLEALRILWETVQKIREAKYEAVLDFQALLKSGLLTGLARGKRKLGSPSTYGHMREGSGLFSRQVPLFDNKAHLVDRHFRVVEELLGYEPRMVPFSYATSEGEKEKVDSVLDETGWIEGGREIASFILIHPFASWQTRCWPIEYYTEVAMDFLRAGVRVGVIGGGGESQESVFAEMHSRISSVLPTIEKNRFAGFMGRLSLKETGMLMHQSRLVIANDSGPMHLASAMGVRTVAIFGPTDPNRLGPYFPETGLVISKGLECQPCMKRRCPIGTLCMTELDPKTVFEESFSFMNGRRADASFRVTASPC
jgi:lipopolysaccharide heptosyltransferase I